MVNVDGTTTLGSGTTLALTEDMTVASTGELTLDIADISSLSGGKVITVEPEGKLKLANGRQITVKAGTLYKLKAST